MAEKILAGIGMLIMVVLVGSSAYRLHAQEAKAATAPKENCEQYYQKAFDEAKKPVEWDRSSNTPTMRSIMYSLLYQSCLAHQNKR